MKTLLFALLLCCAIPQAHTAEILHEERSLYRNIVVKQHVNRRCLIFSVRKADRNQSCMDTRFPELIVFAYVKMVFAGLLVNPEPKSILVVGLGGGTIPVALASLYPDAHIDSVEIDPAVDRVARQFFDFKESAKMSVTIADARVFIRRAGLRKAQYDFIVLDAFTGDYIPEHLMTVEFLREVRQVLAPHGVLVANTFSSSRLYDHESVTYADAFGSFFNFRMPGTANRVILASESPLPTSDQLNKRAKVLENRLRPLGVEIIEYVKYLSTDVDWNTGRRKLSDQFSPANLLQGDSQ